MSIRVRLSKRFGSFDLKAEFEAPERGVTGLLGPSGSGKTSLLRCMAGLERADGEMSINLEVWQDRGIFTPPHRRPVGYVFQEASLFDHLSVRDNLIYGWRRVGRGRQRFDFDRAVDLLGLGGMLDRGVGHLSGGERQRVAMARALLSSPRLLLMDEPLSSLDIESKNALLPVLDRLHRELEIPMIYVSHAPDEVARLADYIILMNIGRVTASGTIQEVFSNLDIPLASSYDAESMIEGTIVRHDNQYHLSEIEVSGGRLWVTQCVPAAGEKVRLRIMARDVSLALERKTGSSILNILPATVLEKASAVDLSQVTVKLAVGNDFLLSRITRKSADALGIHPGMQLFAQIKAVSMLA